LDDGLTAKGKPIEHHLMVKDNFHALRYTLEQADKKTLLSLELLQQCNSLNMANTGIIRNTTSGTVDGTKGEFRKSSAMSEALGYYAEYSKIPSLVNTFCSEINRQILSNSSIVEHLTTSFDAHANLVLIHPWMNGNKRISRLITNYIQRRADLPLTKVHKEDSREYLFALKEVKNNYNIEVFRTFMYNQYIKTLNNEILDYTKASKSGFHLVF
jgi:Fic family protein